MRFLRPRKAGPFLLLGFISCNCYAQAPAAPGDRLKAIFTPANKARLCNSDNRVRSTVLLGELGKVYQINLFALPNAPSNRVSRGVPPPVKTEFTPSFTDPVEERTAYWITASTDISADRAKDYGLGAEHKLLTDIAAELPIYAHHLAREPGGKYRLAPEAKLGDQYNIEDRANIIKLMLTPATRPGAEPTAAIICIDDAKPEQPKPGNGDVEKPKKRSTFEFAVRGSIDELAVPRNGRSAAFKKTSEAKVAYTMNGAKGDESVAANVVVGAGWTFADGDALLGFARYNESSTETVVVGDEDDAKDIRARSAGLLYRHQLVLGKLIAHSGITVYKTWDSAQDSQIVRARAFAEDITVVVPGGPIFCGRQSEVGSLYYSCRMNLFAEKGRVLDAGRSADFADPTDDDYAGAGGEIALSIWLADVKPLSQLMFTAQYKKMWVVSGDLENPDRFTVELAYKLPDSDISFGLSRSYGQNFDTFQKEEVNLFSVGFKF